MAGGNDTLPASGFGRTRPSERYGKISDSLNLTSLLFMYDVESTNFRTQPIVPKPNCLWSDSHALVHLAAMYITWLTVFRWLTSLPPAIPMDLASDLERLHGAPFVWFIGHLTAYLMRPTLAFELLLNSTLEAYKIVGFNRSPVVGVHVRRTDKVARLLIFVPYFVRMPLYKMNNCVC
ncbi:hypothetical protein AHF37_05001 [Paragonimus kellicotti]|nr:hypothetical protein AHF37_05001 [Paragonimus kellicotti]